MALSFRLRALALPRRNPLPRPSLSLRPFSTTPRALYPRADSQDKDSMNTEAQEYAKSGTDVDAANQDSAAFDPSKTDPMEQKEEAGKGKGDASNPLEVSPANPEVSKQRPEQEGGSERATGSGRERTSGGGSPAKGQKTR
ncbi:hypothetical protein MMC18_008854 [Xylographa bjoerkii]|nr:hypothetical protein [Xylographa bjoerkii]MCJ1395968.1 hypothetical protein [Xylographa bjoerkii]